MNNLGACGYCGSIHTGKCPTVKAFEYHPDGTIKRVEFYAPVDYRPIEGLSDFVMGPGSNPRPSDVRTIERITKALLGNDSTDEKTYV
jgi:hypothetical protein